MGNGNATLIPTYRGRLYQTLLRLDGQRIVASAATDIALLLADLSRPAPDDALTTSEKADVACLRLALGSSDRSEEIASRIAKMSDDDRAEVRAAFDRLFAGLDAEQANPSP